MQKYCPYCSKKRKIITEISGENNSIILFILPKILRIYAFFRMQR